MRVCRLSLRELPPGAEVHPAAVHALFGTDTVPTLDLDIARLHTLGLAMVGRTSMSGVQRKLSLGLDAQRMTLRVAAAGRQFILKPETGVFPGIPANEHVTMSFAGACGIEVPPHGLMQLRDGSDAFIVLRFDRPDGGGKLPTEDFCQLTVRPPKDKYRGSAELCAKVVRRYASAPLVELRKLLRQLMFAWWTGNGDLHLKNLSLVTHAGGRVVLSPAYDLVHTQLVIPGDPIALPVQGKRSNLRVGAWRRYAEAIGLPGSVLQEVAQALLRAWPEGETLVARSALSDEHKAAYVAGLAARGAVLQRLAGG